MIVEFIGQGIHEDENDTCGNHICSSIKNDVFTSITVFVAFLRKPGLLELKPFIEKAVSENRQLIFFVGRDENITSKQALELLLELGVQTYIYNSDSFIYHPKVYLFEGIRNRIIIGSSNLTKAGLFYNVESSILLDFTDQDKSGLKVLNQLKDYFSPLLEFTDPNIELATQEHIDDLFIRGLISSEEFEKGGNFISTTHDKSKSKSKNPEIGELGNIEITENSPSKNFQKQILKITDAYLVKWDFMFGRMKQYKETFGTSTVKRDYEDRTLYGWYRKQKMLYVHPEIKMPQEHISKLLSIDFYFGDGHKLREANIENNWIDILQDAVLKNEDIRVNHRYIYNGVKLGTFLVGVSQANKQGKKLELREKIEATGFSYSATSRNIEDVIARLIKDLYAAKNPNKLLWRNRFIKHIDKKEKLDDKTIKEIEFVWEYHFNEKPFWEKQHDGFVDRVDEWRNYKHETGHWFPIKIENGNYYGLYHWVGRKFDSPKPLLKLLHKFTDTEINELRGLGFKI
jgi:HKD family nuclease